MPLDCRARVVFTLSVIAGLVAGGRRAAADDLPPAAARKVDFRQDIQPLLAERCHACHGADMQEGGLRLHRKADGLAGGDRGPAIVPGDSAASRLILYVTGQNADSILMPPAGD